MNPEQQHTDESTVGVNDQAAGDATMTRRKALEVVGKHAVYTAPAVLAILAATKSTAANAGSTIS